MPLSPASFTPSLFVSNQTVSPMLPADAGAGGGCRPKSAALYCSPEASVTLSAPVVGT